MEFPEGFRPGPLAGAMSALLEAMEREHIVDRIRHTDHTVWQDDPTGIADRLGWLDSPTEMAPRMAEIRQVCQAAQGDGYTHALLLGMGGSSLAPEVFRLTFGVADGCLDLAVLDSTDPGAVLAAAGGLDFERTLFIPATKSGGTVETLSFLKYFYGQSVDALGTEEARRHFVAITDPGSGLAELAAELGFRHVFLNNPDIGGRYSALSCFGLVPAALIGMDLGRLLEGARAEALDAAPAATLGALMAAGAAAGRDKATLLLSPDIAAFGAWVEQLLAESTGKEGKGILPVHGEPLRPAGEYGQDRLFVELRLAHDDSPGADLAALEAAGHPVARMPLRDAYDLGSQFFRWEMATALAAYGMRINPFDQPDVEAAKVAARHMVDEYRERGALPVQEADLQSDDLELHGSGGAASLEAALSDFLRGGTTHRSYIALQAYLHATPDTEAALQSLRLALLERTGLATTVGYGPRFLHSTGQLHKGDAGYGLFLQLTADPPGDAAIPDTPGGASSSITFGVLEAAQALGDRRALLEAGRRVLRIHLGHNVAAGLERLRQTVVG